MEQKLENLPESLQQSLTVEVLNIQRDLREHVVSELPKVSLEEKHIANIQMVLDRKAMLERIGRRNTVAELGVDQGEFSEEILGITKPSVFHLVDSWGCHRYHEGKRNEVTEKFQDKIDTREIRIHRKMSTEAASDFEDEYFDFIYIDTNHSYETTRAELDSYLPKMKPDGIIAGHDYTMGNWVAGYRYGVIEAVHEFCVDQNWEIIYLTAETLENQSFAIRRIE